MENKIKGTRDYWGVESKRLQLTIDILEQVAKEYNLDKIVTPTIENTSLFSRAVGSDADVVNKEMYTFEDRKGRSISLKPEGTASVVRMAIENNLLDNNKQPELYYISSMFRYERPQKGRQREFFQFGVENFGKDCVYVDLETIKMADTILKRLDITKYELEINSIGTSEDRKKYNDALNEFVSTKLDSLSDYAKAKIESGNTMRVFDSKTESDLEALVGAPKMSDYLSPESRVRFAYLKKRLEMNNIEYVVNETLVRGLDYYNDLVFEFISTDVENLGSKSTIIGGGRYDSLVKKMDESRDVPAVGFAIGLERLMIAANNFLNENVSQAVNYFIACVYEEDEMQDMAFKMATDLRLKGFSVVVDYSDKKLIKKFDFAEKINAAKIIVVGNEIKDGTVTVKDLINDTKTEVKIEEI